MLSEIIRQTERTGELLSRDLLTEALSGEFWDENNFSGAHLPELKITGLETAGSEDGDNKRYEVDDDDDSDNLIIEFDHSPGITSWV
jgi:hypothetical protein